MKFSSLIFANLFRKKIRLVLTIGSFAVALFLFAFLAVVRDAFNRGADVAGADRLVIINRTSIINPIPLSYRDKMLRIPGVKGTAGSDHTRTPAEHRATLRVVWRIRCPGRPAGRERPSLVPRDGGCAARSLSAAAQCHQDRHRQCQECGDAERALERSDECCGFGGSFAVRYPGISGAMVQDKAAAIDKSGATVVVATDAGCLMNIGGRLRRIGSKVLPMHLAEVLVNT